MGNPFRPPLGYTTPPPPRLQPYLHRSVPIPAEERTVSRYNRASPSLPHTPLRAHSFPSLRPPPHAARQDKSAQSAAHWASSLPRPRPFTQLTCASCLTLHSSGIPCSSIVYIPLEHPDHILNTMLRPGMGLKVDNDCKKSAVGLHLVDPDRGFVPRTDASDYAIGAVLEQVLDDGRHVPVAFWSRVLAEGQRRTWTPREKEADAIVMALRKWAGYIALHPVIVCTDHQVRTFVAQGARGHPLRSRLPTGKMA